MVRWWRYKPRPLPSAASSVDVTEGERCSIALSRSTEPDGDGRVWCILPPGDAEERCVLPPAARSSYMSRASRLPTWGKGKSAERENKSGQGCRPKLLLHRTRMCAP